MTLVSRELKEDGEIFAHLRKVLKSQKIKEPSIDYICNNSKKIVSQCVDPESKQENNVGIIVGRVQSGKTANFIQAMGLAFDNGFKLSIVLTGNDSDLCDQTFKRISKCFKENSIKKKVVVLNVKDNKELLEEKEILKLASSRKIVIVGLKNKININLIKNIFNNSLIKKMPTIIFDDEGDQASLDNNALKPEKPSTAIYSAIGELRSEILVHSYITVTATPQANILVDKKDPISPDFCVFVYPSDDYCGLSTFHSKNSPYIVQIPQADNKQVTNNEPELPASLKEAIRLFVLACSIDEVEGVEESAEMLIHTSHLGIPLKMIYDKVSDYVNLLIGSLKDKSDSSYEEIINEFKETFSKHYENKVPYSFKELENLIESILNNVGTNLITSNENIDNRDVFTYNIYIGGNKLQRGVTFDRLIITYITRVPKKEATADNTEQRARWFGYRSEYLQLCRVFANQKLISQFSSIYEAQELLWDQIEEGLAEGKNFKEIFKSLIYNDTSMIPTRKTVANVKKINSKKISSMLTQQKLIRDIDKGNFNKWLLEKFKQDNFSKSKSVVLANSERFLLEDFDYRIFFNEVLKSMYYHEKDNNINKSRLEAFLKNEFLIEDDYKVDIIWMKKGSRTLTEDDTIVQIFEGPRKTKEYNFLGDTKTQKMLNREHRLLIMIYYVTPMDFEDKTFYSPAFSFIIPERYSDEGANEFFSTVNL